MFLIAMAAAALTPQQAYSGWALANKHFDATMLEHKNMEMMRNPRNAVANFRAKPEVADAERMIEANLACGGDKTAQMPGYDCTAIETNAAKLLAASKVLQRGAFIVLQARYSILDMHGINPAIGKPHTGH